MNTTRIIKVFLASSITELKDERRNISSLGDDISNLFSLDDIAVRFVKCENLHIGNIGEEDQKAIDERLRNCELSLFLFKAKAGDWTIHEFNMARELQKKKSHKIFVYFLRMPDDEKADSLKAFKQRLNNEHIFWKECDNLSEVMLSFSMGVLTHIGITVDDGTPESKAIVKDGDSRFEQYKKNEQQQLRLREDLHKDIDDLLEQIEPIMSDKSQLITARIIQAIELYEKADRWAAATAYDKEKYSRLLYDYAGFLCDYGLYKDSEAIYLRQIPLVEELHGRESKEAASSYNNIGMVYMRKGEYNKALGYHFKALETREKILGTKHPSTAASYNNIGEVYDAQDDISKALEYHFKALAVREKSLGTEHSDTAESYLNIGQEYYRQGDYDMALEYFFKASAIHEKQFGTEHKDTATSYNNIGLVYYEQSNYDKALEYHFKALAIYEKNLGTEHPFTATSYNNIGLVYYKQGNYGKALEYYKKALSILEKLLGTEHPYIATIFKNISAVYYQQGDYNKALDYLDKTYQIYQKILGPEHPDTKATLEWIEAVKKAM